MLELSSCGRRLRTADGDFGCVGDIRGRSAWDRNPYMRGMRKLPVVPICRSRLILFSVNQLDADPKSDAFSAASHLGKRGVCAIVTKREAGCDGRVGDAREIVVRTNGADADVKACGPGLPTLRSSHAVTNRVTTGAIKPGSRGERAINVKTIAQGGPGLFRLNLWFLPRAFLLHGGHGSQSRPGLPCALR